MNRPWYHTSPAGVIAVAIILALGGYSFYAKHADQVRQQNAAAAQAAADKLAAQNALEKRRDEERRARFEAARDPERLKMQAEANKEFQRSVEIELNRKALNTLRPVMEKWDDAMRLASSSPRIALPRQIEALQAIKREFAALRPASAPCMAIMHARVLAAMEANVAMLLAFLVQDEAAAKSQAAQAEQAMAGLQTRVDGCLRQ